MLYQVTDWDDAYANGLHIPRGDDFPAQWEAAATTFRATARREDLGRGDLFLPDTTPKGLAVFIHGGFWMKTSPATWSHLAAGPLAQGWAVAMPAYTLAPKARISQMTREIAAAISLAAERIPGPLAITGHSAGGHLAARMICDDSTLPDTVAARVACCLPISPLSDLRPMMRTAMNDTLAIDGAEAAAESPALLTPRPDIPVTAWVGAMERPEFIRQARLLADIWAGLGAATDCVIEPGLHHFDIIDALTRPDSPLTRTLLA
ncbi:alpha/beta hydrolase [Paracoccus saliphilus]|uniref:Acetyl esterase/lipase n=1 Tax=Paracoccus saliphilus TaxID=405559 RepID=A0AA46A568_9RHOB|nr:alpha/beta hydrolase [Paracoccus saliphilus]WCR02464.1 alpha/beta hydrolase [Paracoccus saliphilus]SIS76012.1 Acetyl esterase/lipase [Paracoccus saliphilus]